MTPQESSPAPNPPLAPSTLHWIRGHRVILDADLASLYGVTTKRFNQAFKRNEERFPEDFAFRLTPDEAKVLRSQIVTSKVELDDRNSLENLRSQFAASKISDVTEDVDGRGGRRYLPWVFTEHGAV